MTITRRSLADTYGEHDAIIEAAQTAKRDATMAYRGHLDALGMDKDSIKAEIEGFKLAYRRKVAIKKKGEDVVEHRDAIADEIFEEITRPAPRATRVASDVPEHDADGVITESTAARMDVRREADLETRQSLGQPIPAAGTQAPPVDTSSQVVEGLSLPFIRHGSDTSSAGMEGEADRQPIIEPEAAMLPQTVPFPGPVNVLAGQASVESPATNITPIHRINPKTHFANSKGLPRLHGCMKPEACGGSHRALCFSCSVKHDGPAYQGGVA